MGREALVLGERDDRWAEARERIGVRARDGRLFVDLPEGGSFEMFAKDDRDLFSPPFGPITFQLVETEGKVSGLKASNGREFKRIE